jgi:hypothetical protein
MMRFTSRWILSAAVSTALLLGAVATSHAQAVGAGGTPIVNGGGHWVVSAAGDTVGYNVTVVQLPDGSISGKGGSYFHSVSGNAGIQFDVVDVVYVGEELFVLSRITQAHGVQVELGSWALLAIQDNGDGQGLPDKAVSDTGNIPSFVPIEVIQQIVTLSPEDGGPPGPDMWFPLAGGNFTIH